MVGTKVSLQFAGECISKTLSDRRSIACTSFVYSGSRISWNFGILCGVLKKSRLEESSGKDFEFFISIQD